MSPFKCSVCSREGKTARSPADCRTPNRCDFVYFSEDAEAPRAPLVAAVQPEPAPAGGPPALEQSVRTITPALLLTFRDRQWTLDGPTVLGRNGTVAVELFREFQQVSRRHCELTPLENNWWLTNLSERSPTRLDSLLLAALARKQLTPGRHDLLLGDAMQFTLTLSPETAGHESAPDPLADYRRRRAALGQMAKPVGPGTT